MTDDSGADTFTLSEMPVCESCGNPMYGTNDLCNECVGSVPITELEQLAAELLELHAKADTDAERYGFAESKHRIDQLIAEYTDE